MLKQLHLSKNCRIITAIKSDWQLGIRQAIHIYKLIKNKKMYEKIEELIALCQADRRTAGNADFRTALFSAEYALKELKKFY